MKRYLTPLAFLASTFAASAGTTLVLTPRPEVTPPVALSCERYLVPGTNYYNFHAGCTPAGNEKGDDERQGNRVDIGDPQNPKDDCYY